MKQIINTDVLVIGGGMAGLWTLARLRQEGYSALLLEKDALGAGQSIASQGIIHGGTKYALQGSLTRAADAIADMPASWRACLQGGGSLDLNGAGILSEYHYLWSPGGMGSRMAAFFASKAVRGKVDPVARENMPGAFSDPGFKGVLYRLNEIVLDIPSIFRLLGKRHHGQCLRVDAAQAGWLRDEQGITGLQLVEGPEIRARRYVFTAGAGNGELVEASGVRKPKMQLRPLHMVMVRRKQPAAIFAHCLGTGSKPRTTITTHSLADGSQVWWCGGELAEADGVARSETDQIAHARKELGKVLPWIDLEDAEFACLRIDRAEPESSDLSRPDSAYVEARKQCIVAWPTKLALSPNLAEEVLQLLKKDGIEPQHAQPDHTGLPEAAIARTPWQQAFE